jgi:hypothetical protein
MKDGGKSPDVVMFLRRRAQHMLEDIPRHVVSFRGLYLILLSVVYACPCSSLE